MMSNIKHSFIFFSPGNFLSNSEKNIWRHSPSGGLALKWLRSFVERFCAHKRRLLVSGRAIVPLKTPYLVQNYVSRCRRPNESERKQNLAECDRLAKAAKAYVNSSNILYVDKLSSSRKQIRSVKTDCRSIRNLNDTKYKCLDRRSVNCNHESTGKLG